ncbi:MAG: right-handed parallel beta-helix repeat-containing protein [Clostridia bacterium]|nr:right-handed parallel beta-helix repeat-containing protein [Clostridia bacterium]
MKNVFDITEFGAVGDGVTDSTEAIRAAAAAAAEVHGVIMVPPGVYCSGSFHLGEGVTLQGMAAWSYRSDRGSVIVLNDPEADCLVDITGGFGCAIKDICLNGRSLGKNIHGVKLEWERHNGGGEEDTPTVDNCRIGNFTGNGLHFSRVWCYSVRHCMIFANSGAGLYMDGWDAFILDNWFAANAGGGIRCGQCLAAVTMTGNRIEWNGIGGVIFASKCNGDSVNINGNFFDDCGGPAIKAVIGDTAMLFNVTVTGNTFRRSGKHNGNGFENPYYSSHIYLEHCINWVITGNTFCCGDHDPEANMIRPEFGIAYGNCESIMISKNIMNSGAKQQNTIDLGNTKDIVISENIGNTLGENKRWWPSSEFWHIS